MRAIEAVEQIRNTAFKPGWRFEASPYGGDLVMVELLVSTVDTSYPDADGICRRKITILGGDKVLNVRNLDESGVCYELLRLADEADEHENREFLKVRQPDGSWVAPLHPHTREGNRRWDQLSQPVLRDRQPSGYGASGLLQALGLEG